MVHIAGNAQYHIARFFLQFDKTAHDGRAPFGVQHFKRQIFQIFADRLHAHAARKGRKNIHGFTGFLNLFSRAHCADGAHIGKPVRQLNQNNPHILRNRHQQLADILGFFGFSGTELHIG